MNQLYDTPIAYLKGVGSQRADILVKELSIATYGQLLRYFPFRYIDRSKSYLVSELQPDMPHIQLKGTISQLQEAKAESVD